MKERSPRRLLRLLSFLPNGAVRSVVYFVGLALTAQLLHAVTERPRDEVLPYREPALPCGPPDCAEERPRRGVIEYVIPTNPVAVINRTYTVLSPPF